MTPRRAITPPSGSVRVPRIASLKAPADATPTIAPPVVVRRKELEATRRTLTAHADAIRGALMTMSCHPLELTSVLAAIDHLLATGDDP
jgi:hypothetical protein